MGSAQNLLNPLVQSSITCILTSPSGGGLQIWEPLLQDQGPLSQQLVKAGLQKGLLRQGPAGVPPRWNLGWRFGSFGQKSAVNTLVHSSEASKMAGLSSKASAIKNSALSLNMTTKENVQCLPACWRSSSRESYVFFLHENRVQATRLCGLVCCMCWPKIFQGS